MSEASAPERAIRQYVEQQGGTTEAIVRHLLTTFGVDEDDEEGREAIAVRLTAAGLYLDRPLRGLGSDDPVRLSLAPSASDDAATVQAASPETTTNEPPSEEATFASPSPAPPAASPPPTTDPSSSPASGLQSRGWVRVSERQRLPLLTSLACAGLLIIGGFGPWVTFGPISVAGTAGDGWLVIASGALAAGLLGRLNSRRGQFDRLDWFIPVAAAVGAVIVLMDIVEILDSELIAVGWGAWAAAIGGTVLVASSIYLMVPTAVRLVAAIIAALVVEGGGLAAGEATSDESESSNAADAADDSTLFDEPDEEEAPPSPEIRVTEQGFSQTDTGTSYAAVLRNPSAKLAATDVEVTVNLLDDAGTVVSTETASVAAIPPDSEFGIGGTGYVEGEQVTRIQVRAKAAEGSEDSLELARADSIRIIDSEFSRDARAQITNSGRKRLSSIADIFFVFRDDAGQVVGGAQTFPNADIPPDSKAAVETTDVPKSATRAEVYVDPEG